MRDHENEDWYQLYRETVVELEHIKMTGRIRDARVGIDVRIEALRHVPGSHDEENVAILDALNMLRTLEREEQRLAEEEKKRLAAEALQKIGPLGQKIRKFIKGNFGL